jgi:hypothetical protein
VPVAPTVGRPGSPEDLVRILRAEGTAILAMLAWAEQARAILAAADTHLMPARFIPLVGIHGTRSREDRG